MWWSEYNQVASAGLVNNVFAVYAEMADAKNIVMENKIDPGTSLSADYNILHSVFRNLLANAIKYTAPGGQITVNSISAGSEITLSVTDNGPGMTAEKKEMLFDKERLDEKSHPESGTGLGLLLCKELIESAGGHIDLISALGQGTTVSFTLPVYPVPGELKTSGMA